MNTIDQALIQRLHAVDLTTVKKFSFEGFITYAKVIKVHDADTVTLLFEYNDTIVKYNVRIDGIDAPELHSKIPEEANLSKKGKEYLTNIVLHTIVKVVCKDFDKYGRILADIYTLKTSSTNEIQETNVSQLLLRGGYVRTYNGGTKAAWVI